MCGIVGIINKDKTIKHKLDDVFDNMLFADQLRGTDGAGVFWYNQEKNVYNVVKNSNIVEVWSDKDYKSALKWIEHYPFIVGHNRAATRGTVTSENNHPFDEGDVILVHNGTMSYIPDKFDKDTKVDSHAIAKMISKSSTEEFIKDSFGAYALVWFNKKTYELNLLRNKDRPLSLVYFDRYIAIASEADLAVWIGKRNGFKLEKVEDIKEHFLYQFEPFNPEPRITDLSTIKGSFTDYDKAWGWTKRYAGYPALYDDDEELNSDGSFAYVSMSEEARRTFEKIDPWKHFNTVWKIKSDADVKIGDDILISAGSITETNKFIQISGTIKGYPVSEYEVRGNIAKSYKELIENDKYLKGTITSIHKKNGITIVWVKELKITDIPDPNYYFEENSLEETQEKK